MAGEERRTAQRILGLPDDLVVPSNVEMEQAVLGALLVNNGCWTKCADILDADCFFEPLHQQIFGTIAALITQNKTANPITLRNYLPEQDLGGVTVREYLARLAAEGGLPGEVRGYAMFLNDLKVRRQVISIAADLLTRAYNAPVDDSGKALVDTGLDRLAALRPDPEDTTGYEDFSTVSYRAILQAQEAFQADGALVGLSTGLERLDDALGGLQKTDLIIIAGRPAMGKTSLATNIAYNVALALKAKRDAGERTGVVAFASLEMSAEQLATRIICERAEVPGWKVRRGKESSYEFERMVSVERELKSLPLRIDKTAAITITHIRQRARDLKKRYGLELLVIDYLQLMTGTSKRREENRAQEISEITKGLKELAKELEIPIIALSQLNRDLERRDDKRPMLADLKESGSIEQDADVVMFVYREEYYHRKTREPNPGTEAHLAWHRKAAECKGVAEIIIGKARHGPEGIVELGFNASLTKFLPVPEPRDILPDQEREAREPPLRLPKEALPCLRELADLATMHPTLEKDLPGVPSWASRPVSWDLWRQRCATRVYGPAFEEKSAVTLLNKIFNPLYEAGFVQATEKQERPFIWLTTKGQRWSEKYRG